MVASKSSSYEEFRRQRVEENKKRMEALNLPILSQALSNSSPKPSPMKKVKPRTVEKQLVVVRRSGRIANQPTPVYKEVIVDRVLIPRRYKVILTPVFSIHFKVAVAPFLVFCCYLQGSGGKRDLSNRVYASDEARADAIEKAEKLQAGLLADCPSFMKSMLQSHVSGGFWLGLPRHFCRKNLPKQDEVMTLLDEDGNEYPTIYLPRKTGLSGGWKGFAVAHNLTDGDALVFHLIRRTAFKVYIVRANE